MWRGASVGKAHERRRKPLGAPRIPDGDEQWEKVPSAASRIEGIQKWKHCKQNSRGSLDFSPRQYLSSGLPLLILYFNNFSPIPSNWSANYSIGRLENKKERCPPRHDPCHACILMAPRAHVGMKIVHFNLNTFYWDSGKYGCNTLGLKCASSVVISTLCARRFFVFRTFLCCQISLVIVYTSLFKNWRFDMTGYIVRLWNCANVTR